MYLVISFLPELLKRVKFVLFSKKQSPMTGDQFVDALFECDFPQGDLGRKGIDFYRAMLNRLIGVSIHPPTNQDLYDMLQAGFADAVPDPEDLMHEWNSVGSNLSDDAQKLGAFLLERIEWEASKGEEVRAEMRVQMGMGGPGLPANVEPISIIAAYGALCKDSEINEDEEEDDDSEEVVEETCEWYDLVAVFYYGARYE